MLRTRLAASSMVLVPLAASVAFADGINGAWEGPFAFPIPGVHAVVMPPFGHVLYYSYPLDAGPGSEVYVFDPEEGTVQGYPTDANIFCGGQSLKSNGVVMIAGGTEPGGHPQGEEWAFTFEEGVGFTQIQSMAEGRWYPSFVRLKSGQLLIMSGLDASGGTNPRVEKYGVATGWTEWALASNFLPLYPRALLMPNGEALVAGPDIFTQALDTVTRTWSAVGAMSDYRWEGTAVHLPPYPGRVLAFGGFDGDKKAGNTWKSADIIDFNDDVPTWQPTTEMHRKRHHHNAVVLPDGTVLAVGGERFNDVGNTMPSKRAEVFDPITETWTLLAPQDRPRLYHSTAVLLRDGRILTAGGDGEFTIEFFYPPYLFHGPRPILAGVPSETEYGDSFLVATDRPDEIASAALLAPCAVTHSFDQNQRYVAVDFDVVGPQSIPSTVPGITVVPRFGLRIDAPDDQLVAPPGFYMLFLVDTNGVPSVGEFIQLKKRR